MDLRSFKKTRPVPVTQQMPQGLHEFPETTDLCCAFLLLSHTQTGSRDADSSPEIPTAHHPLYISYLEYLSGH